jgi:hypothetical protein
MVGKFNGTQALITRQYPLATFVHCGSHCSNLVVQAACGVSTVVRDALFLVNEIGCLLHQSGKAKAKLQSFISQTSSNVGTSLAALRPLCPTRWTLRVAAIQSMLNVQKIIMETLEELSLSHGDSASRANGILTKLSSGVHILALRIALCVFQPLEELRTALQSRNQTVSGMKAAVNIVIDGLKSVRNKEAFSLVFTSAINSVKDMQLEEIFIPRLRKVSKRIDDSSSQQHVALSAEDHFRVEYFEVIDSAVVQLTDRFNQSGIEKVISLEQALLGRMDDLHFLSCYPELDVYRLDVQLRMFRLSNTFSNVEEAAELIAKLPRT